MIKYGFRYCLHLYQLFVYNFQERNGSETPRGSWASFDLRNSTPDAPIAGLLESWDADTVDSANETKRYVVKISCLFTIFMFQLIVYNFRREMRPTRLFGLYPTPNEAEMIERRLMADEPMENIKHRILGKIVKSVSRFTKKLISRFFFSSSMQ